VKLRAIAIGSGWGAHAARVFASSDRVQLCGIVGTGSPRSEALAKDLGVASFTLLETAIGAISPEIASVAAHETVNVKLVERLLSAGCHVLCSHPVAPAAHDVARFDALARSKGLVAATDYSLRLTAAYRSAREELGRCGALLRVAIETPSRTMVIGVDLAIDLAGPVERVFVANRYPPELKERRERRPVAFGPTVVLEHASGVVTTLVPVPHAPPSSAYQLLLSAEGASLRVALPFGGARRLQYLGKGELKEQQLAPAQVPGSTVDAYAAPMRELVAGFIDSVTKREAVVAPLSGEISVRATWEAFERSVAEHTAVAVRSDGTP